MHVGGGGGPATIMFFGFPTPLPELPIRTAPGVVPGWFELEAIAPLCAPARTCELATPCVIAIYGVTAFAPALPADVGRLFMPPPEQATRVATSAPASKSLPGNVR